MVSMFTSREFFSAVLAEIATRESDAEEYVKMAEYAEHQLELLDKRNERARSKDKVEKQETVATRTAVSELLISAPNRYFTSAEIATLTGVKQGAVAYAMKTLMATDSKFIKVAAKGKALTSYAYTGAAESETEAE